MYNLDILSQPFVLAKSKCYFYHCIHIHNMYLPTYEPPYRWSLRGFPSKHNSAEYANKYHYNPSVISTTAYTYIICIYLRMNLPIGGLLGDSPLNTTVLSMLINTTTIQVLFLPLLTHTMYLPTYEPPYRWSLRGVPL
jgi:hypothetical protein